MRQKLAFILVFLFGYLPLSVARFLGYCVGKIITWMPSNSLHFVTRRNIELTNPLMSASDIKQLVNRSIVNTVQTAFEIPLIWKKSNTWLNKKITSIENEDLLRQAVAENRGVIVLCPHIGNWEVFGRKLSEFAPTTYLYQPPKLKSMEPLLLRGRKVAGARLAPTSYRGINALLKALRSGEITGILPDQQPETNRGLFVPFLGVPAYTMNLIYSLVQKTNCNVVLGYVIRERAGFKIIFKNVHSDIYSEDKLESLVALSKAVEASLEEDPAQYQWEYKRFRKQPDNFKPYKSILSDEELSRFNKS